MRTLFVSFSLFSLLAFLVVLSLSFGAVSLSISEILSGFTPDSEFYFTIHEYRFPRAVLAVLVGAMMALSGALVQGVIRNPLASPDVLGVSQGAGLAAVVLMTLFPSVSIFWLPWAALAGGISAALLLWALCGAHSSAIKLAITGVAMAALYSSAVDFLMLTRPLEINNALLWLTGSLWGRGWDQVFMILPWLVLLPLAFWLAKRMNLISLGDEVATSLGVSIPVTRLSALAIAVGLTASCVAICGPIGFLGLIAPHLARRLVGGRHQILLPCSMVVGMVILLLADLLARTINPPIELPAGIMTAIIGAPYFLWLLLKTR
ncbi:Fe(3+) dicitrate ABC transporter permease subunit FecD [Marinomonas colpomeniae]|uniref:Fe(3+) dicitrate ABC transporter permease subunit FecD n=1 Tax=Marinomonas colpomeniae TaxID=2774408 RepID=A0ABR8P2J5_9GAMM|nr:Fe(3+) dicitrate ABC transporter permease subunit FecD [Marinomonas colpomeniae]MBD5770992.1 Fe(3+) dicitrate ABC transporter permease subunit FecD [Marinomonas colpomeniae]